jgi:hypothetical protein
MREIPCRWRQRRLLPRSRWPLIQNWQPGCSPVHRHRWPLPCLPKLSQHDRSLLQSPCCGRLPHCWHRSRHRRYPWYWPPIPLQSNSCPPHSPHHLGQFRTRRPSPHHGPGQFRKSPPKRRWTGHRWRRLHPLPVRRLRRFQAQRLNSPANWRWDRWQQHLRRWHWRPCLPPMRRRLWRWRRCPPAPAHERCPAPRRQSVPRQPRQSQPTNRFACLWLK